MRKTKIQIFLILFFVSSSTAFSYTEDIALQKCMKNGNYTTQVMIQCSFDRTDYYSELCKKLTNNLKEKLSSNEFAKVIQNQALLNEYTNSISYDVTNILYSIPGTMYYTIASGINYNIYRENYWILAMIDTRIICKNKPENKFAISKFDSEIEKELKKIKNNVNETQYISVIKNQQIWLKYFNDTKNNIIPIFKTQPDIQNYIIRMLYENRLGILQILNHPFEET